MVEFGDIIPYYNAIHLVPNDVSLEAKEWASTEIAKFADKRSKSENTKLAHKDVGALRESLAELR
jgi:hypothetical protein